MGLWMSLLYSVLVLPVFWYSGSLFRLLGQEPQVADLAQYFMHIAGFGMAPALLVTVLKSFLSALEQTRIVLWATLIGMPVNAALNWALIFGHWGAPELGVAGSALATLCTQMASLLVIALYAARHPELRHYQLFVRFWRPDWAALALVFRLGTPIGLTSLCEGGLFQASALMMGWIGTVELTAHGIALELASITFMVHLGLSQAATVRAGRDLPVGGLRHHHRLALPRSSSAFRIS